MSDPAYARLLNLARRHAGRLRVRPEDVFAPIGLFLENQPHRWDYFCTPLNSLTLASTGGDGVHFGSVLLEEKPPYPVVMTVPMADVKNFIVGESLHEFLCLGVKCGFFFIEQLAYDWEGTIRLYQRGEAPADEDEASLLGMLRAEFDLKPWTQVGRRLGELEEKYAARLEILSFDEWRARNGV